MVEGKAPAGQAGRDEFLIEQVAITVRNSRAVVDSARDARARAEALVADCQAARVARQVARAELEL